VVAEIALSLVLLVGAGLLAQSFLNLRGVDPGFEPQSVLTLRVSLPRSSYSEPEQRLAAFRELEGRIRATLGVEAGGFIYDIPMSADREGTSVSIEGDPPPGPDESRIVNYSFVTPGYFEAMGIHLQQGRQLGERDGPGAPDVVIVNAALAGRFFSERDPLRARIRLGSSQGAPRRIVGVVENVKHDSLDRDPMPMVYVPYYQSPAARSMSLAVRGSAPPGELLSSVRATVRGFEPSAPVYDAKTMGQIVSESLAGSRFSALLLGGFAIVALLLAAVGIYGVISFTVARSTAEIGIRTAMGARPRQVIGMVLGRGLALALAGVGVGLVAALALTRVLQSLLFAVTAQDPLTFVGLSALLVAVAALACWLPARRAARIDPMVALRYE
jgi:putative ABC transport system permease protein